MHVEGSQYLPQLTPLSSSSVLGVSTWVRKQGQGLEVSPAGSLLSALVGAAGLWRSLKPPGREGKAGVGVEVSKAGPDLLMWPFLSHALFPPLTEAWLQSFHGP